MPDEDKEDSYVQSPSGLWTLAHPTEKLTLENDLKSGWRAFKTGPAKTPIWLVVSVMMMLLAVKIARVTQGDFSTIREMLSSATLGDFIAPVVLGAVQSSVPLLIFLCILASGTVHKYWTLKSTRYFILVCIAALLVVLFSVAFSAKWFWVAIVTAFVSLAVGWASAPPKNPVTREVNGVTVIEVSPYSPLLAKKSGTWARFLQVCALFLPSVGMIVSIILLTLLNSTYWKNPQIIKVGDTEIVGYVIASNDITSSIMRDDDRSVMIVKNDQLTSAKICRIFDNDERSVYAFLDGAAEAKTAYPWCYGEPKSSFFLQL